MNSRRSQLRIVVLVLALLMLALVAGFYWYARRQAQRALRELPKKLGIEISQQAQGFTFSKSEGGRTLFTIHASKLVQYKTGGTAELHDVSVLVFGREGNRYDQIYGSDFAYDQKTGEVRANGPVEIDLQSYGKTEQHPEQRPDQRPPRELKNPIHVKTSGVVFSQKTGIAQTAERIDFHTPQGNGSAIGARYDSHEGELHLLHDVKLTAGEQTVTAASALFRQDAAPEALLTDAVIQSAERTTQAARLRATFRPDNHLDHLYVEGGFRSRSRDAAAAGASSVSSQSAELAAGPNNRIAAARLTRDVLISSGAATAKAAAALVHFTGKNVATAAELTGGAAINQADGSQLQSRDIRFTLRPDRSLAHANTSSAATLTIPGGHETGGDTTITADKMSAEFDGKSAIQSLHAAPGVKVVSTGTDGVPRTTSSAALDATFSQQSGKTALGDLIETGNVRIAEGPRVATGARARYDQATQTAVLTGNPRLTDTGIYLAAERIDFARATNTAVAQGDVRVSYSETKAPADGAMLSGSGPLHVIAQSATVARLPDGRVSATFIGAPARLWQGANVLQAPRIQFDRQRRTLAADASATQKVTANFVQPDQSGRLVPVRVTASSLRYSDAERIADFGGGVTITGADALLQAHSVAVLLAKHAAQGTNLQQQPSQIQRITAAGGVKLDEAGRKASGDRLLYTAQDAKFVLTGTPKSPPSIFDAEHGTVSGDSLTFYSRDDRVLVESHGTRTVTRTYLPTRK